MKLFFRAQNHPRIARKIVRRFLGVLLLGGAALATTPVQAQSIDLNLSGMRPFTPPANYMSLPGYARYVYLDRTGRWISRREAVALAKSSGAVEYRGANGEVEYRLVDRRRSIPFDARFARYAALR